MNRARLEPDRLCIRSAEPADAEAVSALLGSRGVFEELLQLPDTPIASRLEFLRSIHPDACRLVALVDGQIVAQGAINPPPGAARRRHVRILGIAVAAEWQGHGIGTQLMERLLDWADNWGAVLRIALWVYADNAPAIALYKHMGFVEEGRHRAYALRNGSCVDTVAMARLHPAPPTWGGPATQA